MSLDLDQLPPDLRDAVAAMLARERAEKDRLQAENQVLREMVRLLHLKRYGTKSQTWSDRQLQLLEGEPSVTPEEVAQEADRVARDSGAREPRVPKRDRQHPGRVELLAHLAHRVQVIAVAAEQCHCPRCRKELPILGYEESEQLDMESVDFFVRVVRWEKRTAKCGCVEGVICAPAPRRILPKSKFGDEQILEFIDQKFGGSRSGVPPM